MRKQQRGFTLIELVIAGSIVVVLTALAIPAYTSYVMRSNRAVARGVLVDLAAKQEVLRLQTQSYATTSFVKLNGYDVGSYYINRSASVSQTVAADSLYQISLVATSDCGTAANAGFQLVATPVSGSPQARDTQCTSICLGGNGLRKSAPAKTGTDICWTQ